MKALQREQRLAQMHRSQWGAQFLVAAELTRRGYVVAFTMGDTSPLADLLVAGPDDGARFLVDVIGTSSNRSWFVKKRPERRELFYVLVRMGASRREDRFFIMKQSDVNKLIKPYGKIAEGFAWTAPHSYEDKWDVLPAGDSGHQDS
jgi:hypothetical protein